MRAVVTVTVQVAPVPLIHHSAILLQTWSIAKLMAIHQVGPHYQYTKMPSFPPELFKLCLNGKHFV